jgi:hypothetical protein
MNLPKVKGKRKVEVPQYVKDNPDFYYYDPRTGKYPRRIGFPVEEGAGHAIPCFAAGTEVATPEGPRAIETLKPGDVVFAFCAHTQQPVARRVLETHTSSTRRFFEVNTGRARVLATADHRFWVAPGDWRAARDLTTSSSLRTVSGELLQVESLGVVLTPEEPTYNLTVEIDSNYFVGGDAVLVHNDGPFVIYLGRDPSGKIIYVGQTEQALPTRQSQHQTEGNAPGSKVPWKADMTLEYATGPDGKLLTNLSHDEAHYWERKIFDRELGGNPDLKNRIVPYNDESMQKLIKKHCP